MSYYTLRATWVATRPVRAIGYTCGFCGVEVGPNEGYESNVNSYYIAICPRCNRPSFLEDGDATPAAVFGNSVAHVPAEAQQLYDEARECMAVGAYTCAVLGLRTLLAHIAVEKGSPNNQSFKAYVTYLVTNNYAPKGSDAWVDSIREVGNDAAHDLTIVDRASAEQAIYPFGDDKLIVRVPALSPDEWDFTALGVALEGARWKAIMGRTTVGSLDVARVESDIEAAFAIANRVVEVKKRVTASKTHLDGIWEYLDDFKRELDTVLSRIKNTVSEARHFPEAA